MSSALEPYRLPHGDVQVAFSGGRTSAMLLHRLLEANGDLPDRVAVTFQNTGREMPETLDFVQECGQRWGVRIVWLEYRPSGRLFEVVSHNAASRAGEPFDALLLKRGMLPNVAARFCTVELKVRTAKRYLRSLGWDRWTNCVGLRADEPERLAGLPRSWDPAGNWQTGDDGKRVWVGEPRAKDRWIVWTPLADAGVSKDDVARFWSSQPFDLRLPNVRGRCWLGNCDGCFMKSEANLAALARDFPERHAWWEEREGWFSTAAGAAASWSKRYTRGELRRFMDQQSDFDFSEEGVFCQASDGECMG